MRRLARIVCLVAVLGAWSDAMGQTPADEAQRLTAAYHEDPARIDRARDLLERALARDRRVETMIALSRIYLLVGDVRARTPDEKLSAFERGRELGKRAIGLAPKSEDAHFWYVANTGRWGADEGRGALAVPAVDRPRGARHPVRAESTVGAHARRRRQRAVRGAGDARRRSREGRGALEEGHRDRPASTTRGCWSPRAATTTRGASSSA